MLFDQTPLVYFAFLMVPILAWMIRRTRYGLRLRAAGERPEAADALGLGVYALRWQALIASGVLTGLAGAFLTVAYANTFVENISAGRGFVALAVVILGRRNPWGLAAASILFGAAMALQFGLQALGTAVPYQLFLALPYALTLIVLASVGGQANAPSALGAPVHPCVTLSLGHVSQIDWRSMREDVPTTSAFPTARCEPCGKSVLTYVTLDERGDEARCCVHCDGAIVEDLAMAERLRARGRGLRDRLSSRRQTEIRRRMRLRRMRFLRDPQGLKGQKPTGILSGRFAKRPYPENQRRPLGAPFFFDGCCDDEEGQLALQSEEVLQLLGIEAEHRLVVDLDNRRRAISHREEFLTRLGIFGNVELGKFNVVASQKLLGAVARAAAMHRINRDVHLTA